MMDLRFEIILKCMEMTETRERSQGQILDARTRRLRGC